MGTAPRRRTPDSSPLQARDKRLNKSSPKPTPINFSGPIYAILCDSKFFDLFTFDASMLAASLRTAPKCTRTSSQRGSRSYSRCTPFARRSIRYYISGLQSYYERSVAAQGRPRTSTSAWASAAEDALRMAVDAAEKAHGATKEEMVVAGEMAESAYAELGGVSKGWLWLDGRVGRFVLKRVRYHSRKPSCVRGSMHVTKRCIITNTADKNGDK
ncbi:hypothetical protein Q9L58_005598 [Maublancomyces gigas]|uniref:Uncharacterized protein n=1 Tax=Discina gigas TaxID=1032678 RepID=A0ABR3GHQ8_9PEZI